MLPNLDIFPDLNPISFLLSLLILLIVALWIDLLKSWNIANFPTYDSSMPKAPPAEMHTEAMGPDGLLQPLVANVASWPQKRQRILVRLGDQNSPWLWVSAYSEENGQHRKFDFTLS